MQSQQFQLHAQIEDRHWWFVARRRLLTSLVESVLRPCPTTTIVDVGCGTGANLASLAGHYRCVGIDASSHAISLAQLRFPGVKFIRGLAPDDLGEILDHTRMVLLTDVLEHVADDFELLSRLLAATRPGTYFLLTVPADPTLWSRHDQSFGHYRRYDRTRFELLWQGLSVRTLLVSHYNSRLYPLVKMVRGWNRLRGRASGDADTDFSLPGRFTNDLLTRCFAGEQKRLLRLARGETARPYRHGVSLIALLQREGASIVPRAKPDGVAADLYAPAAAT